MKPQTLGYNYDSGRIVPVRCVKDDLLDDLDIQDSCFLLLIIYEGRAQFKIRDISFEAIGPCFVCFDELNSPELLQKKNLRCDSIYFDPRFLNVNMTFSRIRGENFDQVALTHDMFLLKPFTDIYKYVFPIFSEYINNVGRLFSLINNQLVDQPDWYWSCRSRSYFIEIMLLLERVYGLIGEDDPIGYADSIQDTHLKKAVMCIENNYAFDITLERVVKSASSNPSTLNKMFKAELNMSPIEYLWYYRLNVAKKFLEFTSLPIKDIALRCGFKTTQHFSRKFEENFGCNQCGKCSLTDRKGIKFPMMRDFEHRNLIFNSAYTYMGDKQNELGSLGHHFIFTTERSDEIKRVMRSFREKSNFPLDGQFRRMGKRKVD